MLFEDDEFDDRLNDELDEESEQIQFGIINEDKYSPAPMNVPFSYYKKSRRENPKRYDEIAYQIMYELYLLVYSKSPNIFTDIAKLTFAYLRDPTDLRKGIDLKDMLKSLTLKRVDNKIYYFFEKTDRHCYLQSRLKEGKKLYYIALNFDRYFNLVFDEKGNWLPEEDPLSLEETSN